MHLYSILSDSVVYTDYDNFVLVFAGMIEHIQELLDSMLIIKEYIEDYCFANVKEICLFYYSISQNEIFRINPNEEPISVQKHYFD